MISHTIPITITKQQVLDFANLTGDNIPLHTVNGVVQGGLILSMLPHWSNIAIDLGYFTNIPKKLVTVKMECNFKNKLYCDKEVNITFNYSSKLKLSKINWSIHDTVEYCSGNWILCQLS